MSRKELKDYLKKKNEKMLVSKYESERKYESREMRLYAYAAGYAPKTTISDVFDIVQEIMREKTDPTIRCNC